MYHVNTNQKKAILESDKADFKTMNISRGKEELFKMSKSNSSREPNNPKFVCTKKERLKIHETDCFMTEGRNRQIHSL